MRTRWWRRTMVLGALSLCSMALGAEADPLLEPVSPAERALHSWDEAQALLEAHSTDARIAADELVRAQARSRTALAALLPSLNGQALASVSLLPAPAGGDNTTSALFGAAPYQVLSLVAQLTVVDLRAWNALAQAIDAQKVASLSLADARRLLVLALAQAVLTAVASERVAELARAGWRDALERLALAERSNRAGANTELDLGRLRLDAEQARAQVVSGDEGVRQGREALGQVLGLDVPVGVAPDFTLDGLAAQLGSRCHPVADADARPDALAAHERVRVAHRGVLDVGAQFLPSLTARSNAQAYFFGSTVLPIWNLQAVLTVPLWDGGARYGAAREAQALERQAEARAEATVRSARLEVQRAKRGVDVAEQARESARRAAAQAQHTDGLTRKAYEAGVGTSLELVSAAASLRQLQLTVALREYDVLKARVVALFALAECP